MLFIFYSKYKVRILGNKNQQQFLCLFRSKCTFKGYIILNASFDAGPTLVFQTTYLINKLMLQENYQFSHCHNITVKLTSISLKMRRVINTLVNNNNVQSNTLTHLTTLTLS